MFDNKITIKNDSEDLYLYSYSINESEDRIVVHASEQGATFLKNLIGDKDQLTESGVRVKLSSVETEKLRMLTRSSQSKSREDILEGSRRPVSTNSEYNSESVINLATMSADKAHVGILVSKGTNDGFGVVDVKMSASREDKADYQSLLTNYAILKKQNELGLSDNEPKMIKTIDGAAIAFDTGRRTTGLKTEESISVPKTEVHYKQSISFDDLRMASTGKPRKTDFDSAMIETYRLFKNHPGNGLKRLITQAMTNELVGGNRLTGSSIGLDVTSSNGKLKIGISNLSGMGPDLLHGASHGEIASLSNPDAPFVDLSLEDVLNGSRALRSISVDNKELIEECYSYAKDIQLSIEKVIDRDLKTRGISTESDSFGISRYLNSPPTVEGEEYLYLGDQEFSM